MKRILLFLLLALALFSWSISADMGTRSGYLGNDWSAFTVDVECPTWVFRGRGFTYKLTISDIREDISSIEFFDRGKPYVTSYKTEWIEDDKLILTAKMKINSGLSLERLSPFDIIYRSDGTPEKYLIVVYYVTILDPVSFMPKLSKPVAPLISPLHYSCLVKVKKGEDVSFEFHLPPAVKLVDQNIEEDESFRYDLYYIRLKLIGTRPGTYELRPIVVKNEESHRMQAVRKLRIAPIMVDIQFSKDAVLVGEPFESNIDIYLKEDVALDLDFLKRFSLNRFEIMERSVTKEKEKVTLKLKLRTFLEGDKEYDFGDILIIYKDQKKRWRLRTASRKIKVNSVLNSESSDFKSLIILEVELGRWKVLNIYLPAGLAFLIFCIFIFYFIRHYLRRSQEGTRDKEYRYEEERKKLREVLSSELGERELYFDLYHKLRSFISTFFSEEDVEPRTQSVNDLKKLLGEYPDKCLFSLLEEADRVKFDFEYEPDLSRQEIEEIVEELLDFVD